MASLISVGQIFDLSLDHCRKHYKELLAIVLWLLVASIPSIVGKILSPLGEGAEMSGGDWFTFGISLFGSILALIVSLWMYATLILAIGQQAVGKKTDLKKLNRDGWRVFIPYLLLTLALITIFVGITLLTAPGFGLLFVSGIREAAEGSGALAALGVPLFLIGGLASITLLIKYSIELAFAPYLLLLDKQDVIESIKSSIALVRGRWWSTLIRFVIPKIIFFILLFIISFTLFTALELLMGLIGEGAPVVVLLIYAISLGLQVLVPSLVTPLIIATDYYLYKSLNETR